MHNMHKETIQMSTGSINEAGFIANLSRKGFNISKSLGELYANCIDAHATKIWTIIDTDYIYIIDNGKGMEESNIKDMFDVYKENHTNDKSMGVSGIGAKAALKKISKDTEVIILTKHNTQYFTVIVPWHTIKERKKYIDMIEIKLMTEDEKTFFKKHLQEMSGTIIKIKENQELKETLIKQFEYPRDVRPCSERFDIIFSKFKNVTFKYIKTGMKKSKDLERYLPFEGRMDDYYTPITKHTVKIYEDTKGGYDYVVDDMQYTDKRKCIDSNGKTKYEKVDIPYPYIEKCIDCNGKIKYKKETKSYKHLHARKSIGEFDVSLMNRRDDRYFNPDQPTAIKEKIKKGPECPLGQKGWGTKLTSYDNKFFHCCEDSENEHKNDTVVQEYLARPDLIRNSQKIDKIVLPHIKFSSARANIKVCNAKFLH